MESMEQRLEDRLGKRIDEAEHRLHDDIGKRIDEAEHRLHDDIGKRIDEAEHRLHDDIGKRIDEAEQRLHDDLAMLAKAHQESMATLISVIDEKYADLPARVKRLEGTVFRARRR
jgi:hypothetical protein